MGNLGLGGASVKRERSSPPFPSSCGQVQFPLSNFEASCSSGNGDDEAIQGNHWAWDIRLAFALARGMTQATSTCKWMGVWEMQQPHGGRRRRGATWKREEASRHFPVPIARPYVRQEA